MSILELFMIGLALSMDAFAVSICQGLSNKTQNYKRTLVIGLFFGGFQAFMPLLGYTVGIQFSNYITSFSHWIAFILLALIGVNMIRESKSQETEDREDNFNLKYLTLLAIATSIDALAVGITFAFLKVEITLSICIIGITTFIISIIGVKIGNLFGAKYKSKAELTGGFILIVIGAKILIQNL